MRVGLVLASLLLLSAPSAGAHQAISAPATTERAAVLAFPGAEGFGRYSRGGRGGTVYTVTQLGNDGPGSLREAVEASGPRTVVFAVAGTITLTRPLRIEHDRITIAGQSAPGEGITLRDYSLVVAANDVVIRYLRSRLGDVSGQDDADAIWVVGGTRVILDHVSASWSTDETLSVSPRRAGPEPALGDVTVQWSFITESLNQSLHPKGAHGYGSLIRGWRGSRYSFHHNLWAHHRARMPRPGNYASLAEDPLGALMDFRNNVFYNWGASPVSADGSPAVQASGYDVDPGSRVAYNFINNSYQRGVDSRAALAFFEANPGARAWFAGNRMDGHEPADPWSLVAGSERPGYRLPVPLPVAPVATDSAATAYRRVLAHAGASLVRDAVDRRVVGQLEHGGGRIIDSQRDVGGWPVLAGGAAPRSSAGDGIADAWKQARGLDPDVPASQQPDASGYTLLEQYLNELVAAGQ